MMKMLATILTTTQTTKVGQCWHFFNNDNNVLWHCWGNLKAMAMAMVDQFTKTALTHGLTESLSNKDPREYSKS